MRKRYTYSRSLNGPLDVAIFLAVMVIMLVATLAFYIGMVSLVVFVVVKILQGLGVL